MRRVSLDARAIVQALPAASSPRGDDTETCVCLSELMREALETAQTNKLHPFSGIPAPGFQSHGALLFLPGAEDSFSWLDNRGVLLVTFCPSVC